MSKRRRTPPARQQPQLTKAVSVQNPAGGVWPAMTQAAMQAANAGTLAQPLLRPPGWASVPYAPGRPLDPQPINPVRPDSGRPEPRAFEYPVAFNLPGFGDRLVPWKVLRDAADQISLFRRCIEIRKDEVSTLDWDVVISPKALERAQRMSGGQPQAEVQKALAEKLAPEISRLVDFWELPDPDEGLDFIGWASKVLEDYFVLDAIAIYPRYTYGDQPYALEVVDATSIKPLLNDYGRRPVPPEPAFQQIMMGFPRGEFIAETDPARVDGAYPSDVLSYTVHNVRSFTPYGFGSVEQALTDGELLLHRKNWLKNEYCYDEQTEVLTTRGWLPFKELDGTERVASRTAAGEFVWEAPSKYVDYEWDGEVVDFQNSKIDLRVTPNHRMLLGRVEGGANGCLVAGSEFIAQAGDLVGISRRKRQKLGIPTTSQWTAIGDAEKVIASIAEPNRPGHDAAGWTVPMRAWCEFLGLYLAEGSVRISQQNARRRYDVIISQKPESARLDEIRRVLDATPFKWSWNPKTWKFTCSSKSLALELARLGHSWDKFVPEYEKDQSAECLDALLHGFWLGDGFWKAKVRGYATSSRRLADDLQELIQKVGRDATISVKDQSRWAGQFAKRPAYQVTERLKNYQHLPVPTVSHYTGRVYCVTVPSGLLYVRRNGKAAWCGNTSGVMPSGWLMAGDGQADWTPDQLISFSTWFNDLYMGNSSQRHRYPLLPFGMHPVEGMSDQSERYKPEYDLFLIKLVAAHFATTIAELGFTEAKGLGSEGYHEGQADVQDRVGRQPTLRRLQSLCTRLQRRFLNAPPELEFRILGLESEDEDAADETANRRFMSGRLTLNQDLDARGLPRAEFAEADMYMLVSPRGIEPLEGAAERAKQGQMAPVEQPGQPPQPGQPQGGGAPGRGAANPGQSDGPPAQRDGQAKSSPAVTKADDAMPLSARALKKGLRFCPACGTKYTVQVSSGRGTAYCQACSAAWDMETIAGLATPQTMSKADSPEVSLSAGPKSPALARVGTGPRGGRALGSDSPPGIDWGAVILDDVGLPVRR